MTQLRGTSIVMLGIDPSGKGDVDQFNVSTIAGVAEGRRLAASDLVDTIEGGVINSAERTTRQWIQQ